MADPDGVRGYCPSTRTPHAGASTIDSFQHTVTGVADAGYTEQTVIDSGAVGLVDLALIGNDLAQGRLLRLFDIGVEVAPDYACHLVYPASSDDDPRIQAFTRWMLDQAGQDIRR